MDKVLNIIKNDPWLEPYANAINGRHQHAIEKEKELVGKKTLSDFAKGVASEAAYRIFIRFAPS